MRPYSEKEMAEIERDPERLRAYFWRVAQNARRMAKEARTKSRRTGVEHPVNNYRPAFAEGRSEIEHAEVLERFSVSLVDNLDLMVESTLRRAGVVPSPPKKAKRARMRASVRSPA